ncbi:hypothetical protein [Sorangium sp. So ce1389]|uniref:hypothetical protein n=1 Tax=Sorangium sp. So ce1389 TaxID=3133336 RepID=UPI002B805046|nr:hypothetical protein [Sorangium sp.]
MAGRGKRTAAVRAIDVPSRPSLAAADAPVADPPPASQAQPAAGGLMAARLVAFDAQGRAARLSLGGAEIEAALDEALSPSVLATALARGERLVVQREGEGWVVLGALRTAPTPGVDEGDEFLIKARRVLVAAEHEFAIASGAASLVVRAQGFVETVAHDITARASGIHKIVGRIIRLN